MDRYQETFDTWNKIASLYEEKFMHLSIYNDSYDILCKSIENNKAKILDLGCGPGNITKYLLSKNPDYEILGIDISPKMIELAQKNNPTANFKILDCRQISSLNTHFDAIVNGFCLPYLSENDTINFITDSSKLLLENGILYLSFVEGDPNDSEFKAGSTGDRAYFYFHNLETIKTLLLQNNFIELEILKVEYNKSDNLIELHTIIIAKRG